MPLVLLLFFIVIPILEIAAFIQIGSLIGLLPTLGSIVLTAIAGAFLVRHQGLQTINEARIASAEGKLPVGPLFHGAFIIVAGLLLLTPGFITDAIGFLFLIPPLRQLIGQKIWLALRDKVEIHHPGGHYPGDGRQPRNGRRPDVGGSGTVIDAEAEDITEKTAENSQGSTESPWKNINHTS